LNWHRTPPLSPILNAAGTYTPLGVSRSSPAVAQAVGEALGEFFDIDELQAALSETVARDFGTEAAALTHCVAAGITLSVAACMAGSDAAAVAALPDARGLPNRVVLPAGHAVDYGHPILTDIRLAGALPVLAGSEAHCSLQDIEQALAHERCAALLLVCSRLVRGQPIELAAAVAAAHRRGVPAIIDGAAQDLRIADLRATGADLVLISAHKYLASPTAGLIIGRRVLVQACRAQERGIGRAMKATKEALVGVLAALAERRGLDLASWRRTQQHKVQAFIERLAPLRGIVASAVADPAGMPFSRVQLQVDAAAFGASATQLAASLRDGRPSIRAMEHLLAEGSLLLELVPLRDDELQQIVTRLFELAPISTPTDRHHAR
jgi:uncharacterized pyridoxal phosphate-dependent enzyme